LAVDVRITIAVLALTPAVVLGRAASERDAPPRDRDVLARAGDVVRRYEVELPRLVARETSMQQARRTQRAGAPTSPRCGVWLGAFPGSTDVVGVRDVVEVDGDQ
jgi:hypothetical protein